MQNIILALSTVACDRYEALLSVYVPPREKHVSPRYLFLEFAFAGFVFRVNTCLFLSETSNAKGWCGDPDDVNGSEIGAGGAVDKIACFDHQELLRVIARSMDVVDPSAHLAC